MITAQISKSNKPDKRLKVVVETPTKKKTIHFGSGKPTGAGAYVDHKNDKIKEAWEARHKVREDWKDPLTSGFWAKNILWNKRSVPASIKDTATKFNIKIKS